MRNLTTLLFIFFCYLPVQAQRGEAIYAELGGAGLIWTVNYDTRFSEADDKLGARIGFGFFDDAIHIPLQLNYLFGEGNHKLELGLGTTVFFIGEGRISSEDVAASAALMYRFQKKEGGFLFRVGLSPSVFLTGYGGEGGDIQKIFWFWPGISAGYKF